MQNLFKFIGAIVVDIVTYFWAGYIFSIIYNWFIPKIFGLSPISLIGGMGILLVVGFLSHRRNTEEMTAELLFKIWVDNLLFPLIYLFIGWVFHFGL